MKISSKIISTVLAATMVFSSISGITTVVSARELTTAELVRDCDKLCFAKLEEDERDQLTRFNEDYTEFRFKNPIEEMKKAGKYAMFTAFLPVFMNIISSIEGIRNTGSVFYNFFQKIFFGARLGKIDIENYDGKLAKIKTRLEKELVGQDEAVNKIIDTLTGYFEGMKEAKELGKKFEGGLLLYFIGSPATGKSTAMKIIEEEMGLNAYIVRMSDVIEEKSNNSQTIASRLLKPEIEDKGTVKIQKDTKLYQQIKSGKSTLYCFDEIDKMRTLESVLQSRGMRNEQGEIIGSSADEMLRNFGDTGQICGKDVSGSVLIATSNETPEKLKQLENSLYNRYEKCIVTFRDFNKEDYKTIIKRSTENIQKHYEKKYKIGISWNENALESLAINFENKKTGGRGSDALMYEVRCCLKKYRDTLKKGTNIINNEKLSLNFDEKENKVFTENFSDENLEK